MRNKNYTIENTKRTGFGNYFICPGPLKRTGALISFLLVMLINNAFAAVETVTNRWTGLQILSTGSLSVADNKFPNAQVNNYSVVQKSTGKVILGWDDTSLTFDSTFAVLVNVTVASTNVNNYPLSPISASLYINYKDTAGIINTDRNLVAIPGAHQMKITVVSVRDSTNHRYITNPAEIKTRIFLQGEIETERTYVFDPDKLPAWSTIGHYAIDESNPGDNTYDVLDVFWPYMQGAEEYDLEWTYVDNYKGTWPAASTLPDSTSGASLNYDFRYDATRVRVSTNHYRIPLRYDRGFVLYRVRGVGRNPYNTAQIMPGRWSSDSLGYESSSPTTGYHLSAYPFSFRIEKIGMEDSINSQYQVTFAELGKTKEAKNYFDGSLRNRETVSKSNTDNLAIVSQTMYDYQGRKAVQVLPVPAAGPEIKFYDAFEKDAALAHPYDKRNFDLDVVNAQCVSSIGAMNPHYGASHYYSSLNADTSMFQSYVADADSFPFTVEEYTPDNTGRIRRQSGVGKSHKLDSDHETKYFYGQPDQYELDRLFGSEVGFYNHYKKNMVVDANGQIIISYLDAKGKVIATCVSGNAPSGMDDLSGVADTTRATYICSSCPDTINGANRVDGTTLVFSKEILVATAGNYIIDYDIEAPAYTDDCIAGLCFDCTYDLSISLLNQCGEEVLQFPDSSNPGSINRRIGNFILDSLCDSPHYKFIVRDSIEELSIPLTVGSYTLSKKLTVNKEALDYYTDQYLTYGTCFRPYANFLDSALAQIDTSGCKVDCQSCATSLGDSASFVAAGGQPDEYHERMNDCLSACKYTCPCEQSYNMMLSDMSPGGQYAQYNPASTTGIYSNLRYPLSIFCRNNSLPDRYATVGDTIHKAYWRNPKIGGANIYVDEYGDTARVHVLQVIGLPHPSVYYPAVSDTNQVIHSGSSDYVYPQFLANARVFIDYWQPSWAQSLVEYHPEYVYYEWCKVFNDTLSSHKIQVSTAGPVLTSDEFDEYLKGIDTWTQAFDSGYVAVDSISDELAGHDPFFQATFNTSGFEADLVDSARAEFIKKYNHFAGGYRLKQIVSMINRCGEIYVGTPSSGCYNAFGTGNDSTMNSDWRRYRDFYIALKQSAEQKAGHEYARGPFPRTGKSGYNGCIGIKDYPFTPSGIPHEFLRFTITSPPYYIWSPWTSTSRYPALAYQAAHPDSSWGYLDPFQACSQSTYLMYANKTKRFQDGDDLVQPLGASFYGDPQTLAAALQNQADAEYYAQTSQCPGARDLMYLLDNFAQRQILDTDVGLDTISSFTPNLYHLITSPPYTTFVPYTWHVTSSSSTLAITLSPNACGLTLSLPSGSVYTWDSVIHFSHLTYISGTTGTYNFTVEAHFPSYTSVSGDSALVLHGTTCIPISGCSFHPDCPPTSLGGDMINLWNQLASNQEFTSLSNVDITSSPYTPYFSTNITNPIGSGAWRWKETGSSTNVFEIAKSGGNVKMRFTLYPTGGINLSNVLYFNNLRKTDTQTSGTNFTVDAHIENGTTHIDEAYAVEGTSALIHISPSSSSSLKMNDCNPPPSLNCGSNDHLLREDLGNFFNAYGQRLDTMLTTYPEFTPLMQSEIGNPNCFMSHRTISANNDTLDFDFAYTYSDGVASFLAPLCHAQLYFLSPPPAGIHIGDNFFMFWLNADHSPQVDGKFFHFTAGCRFGTYDATEIVGGYTTCLPIANCENCDSTVNIVPAGNVNTPSLPVIVGLPVLGDPGYPSGTGYTVTTDISGVDDALVGTDHGSDPEGSILAIMPNTTKDSTTAVVWRQDLLLKAGTKYRLGASALLPYSSTPVGPHHTLKLYADTFLIASVSVDTASLWQTFSDTFTTTDGLSIVGPGLAVGGQGQGGQVVVPVIIVDQTNGSPDAFAVDDVFLSVLCPPDTSPATSLPQDDTYRDSCAQHLRDIAANNAQNAYQAYMDSVKAAFQNRYMAVCMKPLENLKMKYKDKEGKYTLYYYDQAGNLRKTVPPQGVSPLAEADIPDAVSDRASNTYNTAHLPSHSFLTNYRYNSLNQLTRQKTPDADSSLFWYDKLGRLRFSQNAHQWSQGTPLHSYTKYDALGRIIEVGECDTASVSQATIDNPLLPVTGITQVTKTYYDHTAFSISGLTQENLKKRVASVTIDDDGDGTYERATHYSYDVHGNVKTLVQENKDIPQASQRLKRMDYTYDLVSGNVLDVQYQQGKADQFLHHYYYDADNRLHEVFSSKDSYLWDKDAKYFYYKHGPMAREEVGDGKVQGIDYVYTLQGWIKSVNSNILDSIPDPGKDGVRTSLYSWNQPGLHARVANDAFGYSLSYFDTANGVREYHPIGKRIDIASNNLLASLSPNAALHGNNPSGDAPNLYNGNIRAMVTSLYDITPNAGTPRVPQVTGYRYDQLNRVTQMKAYRGLDTTNTGTYNTWGSGSSDGSYTTHVAYDDNGNILQMQRNGSASATFLSMDSLTYYYNAGTNKLNHVIDSVAASNYSTDIDNQAVNNYDYDEIGNLTQDLKDSIASIEWTVYGKVKKVNRVGGCTMPNLEFRYDASGNRVTKIVKPHNYTSDGDTSHWTKTYYVRDAQGNIMSTYTDVDTDTHLYLSEQMIYGSKRAAVLNRSIDLSTFVVPCSTCANYSDRELGQKQFEMDNHLGNVLASVTDRKLPVSDGAGTPKTRCYLADITSMNDYGVWGDLLPKRNVSSTEYRFGFNGQEKVDEMNSITGSHNTALFWEYDTRLGRRWNLDPKPNPSFSDYSCFSDNSILYSDILGDESDPGPHNFIQKFIKGVKNKLVGKPWNAIHPQKLIKENPTEIEHQIPSAPKKHKDITKPKITKPIPPAPPNHQPKDPNPNWHDLIEELKKHPEDLYRFYKYGILPEWATPPK